MITGLNSAVVEKALKLVGNGFTPVPLNGKIPVVANWQDMTVLAEHVEAWADSGLLKNVGLRTGDRGLVVLDFDGRAGYEAFVAAFGDFADTYTVATGSGNGMHVYFEVAGELPKSTGQLIVPGGRVEVKAKGRQVVVPPSVHPDTGRLYAIFNKTPARRIASFDPIAAWIAGFQPKYEPTKREASGPALPASDTRNYALSALGNMASELAALSGGRNTLCNRMAWKLAHFAAQGDLAESEIRAALEGAMASNGAISDNGQTAFERTFDSGYRDGLGDTDYVPQVYSQPRALRRELPGVRAYAPPTVVQQNNGVTTIGRTRIVQRVSLFADLSQRIWDDDYLPAAPPVIFPLRCLHGLGGQARVTKAGKLIGIVGSSGSGKTSALETIADAWVEAGVGVWMWTPEWSPDEMAERAMQRYGGPTQDELYLHEIDKWRTKTLNQPTNPAHRLTIEQSKAATAALNHVRGWATDMAYIENTLMTVGEMSEVIAAGQQMITPFPRVLIADYAQLLKANEVDERDDMSMYNMLQRFKSLCVFFGLIGVMATQTTKDEARQNIKAGAFKGTTVLNCTKNSRGNKGRVRVKSDPAHLRLMDEYWPNQLFGGDDHLLGSQAGRFVNDDAFNLFVTLNPEYETVVSSV